MWLGCLGLGSALVLAHGERVSRREAELVRCAANPSLCPGRKAFLALVEVVSVDAAGFSVLKQMNVLRIDGAAPALRPGETVSVIAAVQPGGLGLQGRIDVPVTRHFYTPLLFDLPQAMLRPPGQSNELRILVMGYRFYRSGLAPLSVGAAPELRPGETVSVIATVEPGGLGLLSVERHPWRGLKRALGMIGVGLTGLVMALGLRVHGGRLVERG